MKRKGKTLKPHYPIANKLWPIFLPIALVGAAWFVWKARREINGR